MKLLVRADASAQIGSGHVMRCLALAQAWQDAGGEAAFAAASGSELLQARVHSENVTMASLDVSLGSDEDARQTVELAQRLHASWVVLDGYHFAHEYQQTICGAGLRLLFIDDNGRAAHYDADLVLNQNLYANETLYANRAPRTRLLLGTWYALLRREFREWLGWKRDIADVARRVLITLGGSDPHNVTLDVIRAVERVEVDGVNVVAVVGGGNPHCAQLQRASGLARVPVRLARDVADMPDLMSWADVAVSAGGSTCWEAAFMGLPSCVIILAENQSRVAETLEERGIAVNAGWFASINPADLARVLENLCADKGRRALLSERGRRSVDGLGSQRVVAAMLELDERH